MPNPDISALLDEATLPTHSVAICLRGDLVAKHDTAERQLAAAQQSRGDSLDGGERVGELADLIRDLERQMRDSTVEFTVTALPKPKFRSLVAAHPPREDGEEGEKADSGWGFNTETLYPALIRACVVDPTLTEAQWTALFDEKLTDAQFSELGSAAFVVNAGTVSVPFSRAASLARRPTDGE